MSERIHADPKELAKRRAHAASRKAENQQVDETAHQPDTADTSAADVTLTDIDKILNEAASLTEEAEVVKQHIDALFAADVGGLALAA